MSARDCWVSVMRIGIWRGSSTSILSANTVCAEPFSAQPPIHPSDGLPSSAPSKPLLALIVASPTLVTGRISRTRSWLRLEIGSTPRRSRSTKSTCCTGARSEEHTSELQSHSDLVCRLLLEKKKKRFYNQRKTVMQQCDTVLVCSHNKRD